MLRRLLSTLAFAALLFTVAHADEQGTPAKAKKGSRSAPEIKGDPSVLVNDTSTRHAQLKRAFESFRQRLAIMAGRLENGNDKDKEKAKSLRKALKKASEMGTEAKFDSLIRELTKKGADQSIDVLRQAVRDNAELRQDLQTLIAILSKDDSQLNKELMEKHARLLERIKELIAKQERVRAQTEMGRRSNKELEKDQNKVTKETREVIDGKKGSDKEGKPGDDRKGVFKPDGKPGIDGRGEARNDTPSKSDAKPAEGKDGDSGKEGKPGEGKDGKEGKPGEGKEGGKDGEGKDGKGKDGDGKEGKPGDGKPSDGKEGKPGEGKPGDGKEGKSGEGKEGKGGDSKESKAGNGKDGKGGEGKPGESKGDSKEAKGGDGKAGEGKEGKPGDGKPGEGKEGKPGDPKGGAGKQGEGKPSDKPGDGKAGEGKPSGKPGDGKSGEGKPAGKPGEGKPSSESKGQTEGKGEAKPGKPSDGKGGDPKGGKPGGGKPGKPGAGGSGESPPPQEQDDNPVKKQIEDANKYQKQAEIDLDKAKKPDAADSMTKAIKELEAAKKKLEDLLKQMREEEIEKLLADLEKRCRYMLALQIEVRDGTVSVDRDIQKNVDKKPTLLQSAQANKLADKEDEIVREAHAALKLIKTEGSAVAFAEVFEQVSKDMEDVRNRLTRVTTDAVTQQIENDIIETLKEMIAALQKAQKEAKQGKPSQGKSGMPQDQKLIDQIAELKMIYAMQKRVNARTELYGKQYKGEQAPVPEAAKTAKEREHFEMITRELKDLSVRQQKIGKVTRDIATGKNEAK